MYVNHYERLKNFNPKENQDEKKYGQNTNNAYNNYAAGENQLIKEISKLCRDRSTDEQFFALLDRDERNIRAIRDEFISQSSILSIIKIDIKKLELYNESHIFLLKKIVKGLPLVSHEDKKILWDRIKLFSKVLNLKDKFNETDPNTMVILNELDFDEPLEYIKKEFDEILWAYSVNENIVILIENLYGISYKKYRQIIDFLQAVFTNSINFKCVAFINEIHYKRLISSEYGNEEYDSVYQ